MKKTETKNETINVRRETARKRWTMFRSLLLMLFLSALLAAGCFSALLRLTFRADWNAIREGASSLSGIVGGDFIEKNYKSGEHSEDFGRICDAVSAEAKRLGIDRVYVLDTGNLTGYYLYNTTAKDSRIYYKIYGRLGGCTDDSAVTAEMRKEDLQKPVYSTGINGTFLRAWVRAESEDGSSLILCADRYAGESVESCWQLGLAVFFLLFVFYHIIVLAVYFRLIRKPTVSIRELSDDLDQYYASGILNDRQAPDRIVQKIRYDIRHLADKDNAWFREQNEKGKEEAVREYTKELEHQTEAFFLPESEIATESGNTVLQSIHLWDDVMQDDVIDIFPLSGTRLGFMIAKLPRNNQNFLLPLMLKVLFRTEMLRSEYPETAGDRVSKGLRDYFGDEVRVQAFFGSADEDGMIRYVNAGYNIPFLSMPDAPVMYLEGECGKVLGEASKCIGHSHRPEAGSVLVCLSEGNELFSDEEQNTMYGRERLKKLIEDWRAHPEEKDLCEKLSADLEAHAEEVNVTREKTALVMKVRVKE